MKSKNTPAISFIYEILSITDDNDYLDNSEKQARVKELEREIDRLVYELYGLTDEEIEVVEGRGRRDNSSTGPGKERFKSNWMIPVVKEEKT